MVTNSRKHVRICIAPKVPTSGKTAIFSPDALLLSGSGSLHILQTKPKSRERKSTKNGASRFDSRLRTEKHPFQSKFHSQGALLILVIVCQPYMPSPPFTLRGKKNGPQSLECVNTEHKQKCWGRRHIPRNCSASNAGPGL